MNYKKSLLRTFLVTMFVFGGFVATAGAFTIDHPSVHWTTTDGVTVNQFRELIHNGENPWLADNAGFTIYGENIFQNGVKVAERIYLVTKNKDYLNTAENQIFAARSLAQAANMAGMTYVITGYNELEYVTALAKNTGTINPLTFPGYGPLWREPPPSILKK